jgi:hypothetical protein
MPWFSSITSRYRRLTRARKVTVIAVAGIALLTAIALIPWQRFDQFHEATVTPALAATKGERQLDAVAGAYDWRVSNCRERAGVDWPGHWRCDVRTTDPPCHGYVLLDVYEEDHGAADIWHVQNQVRRCAPYGLFGPDWGGPDSEWD